MPVTPTIPGLERNVPESLGIEMNAVLKIGALDLFQAVIKNVGLLPDLFEFLVRKLEQCHV